jgi:hypothetical protein
VSHEPGSRSALGNGRPRNAAVARDSGRDTDDRGQVESPTAGARNAVNATGASSAESASVADGSTPDGPRNGRTRPVSGDAPSWGERLASSVQQSFARRAENDKNLIGAAWEFATSPSAWTSAANTAGSGLEAAAERYVADPIGTFVEGTRRNARFVQDAWMGTGRLMRDTAVAVASGDANRIGDVVGTAFYDASTELASGPIPAAILRNAQRAKSLFGRRDRNPKSVSLPEHALGNLGDEYVAHNQRILEDYEPGPRSGFSGVYDPKSGAVLMRPTDGTRNRAGEIPSDAVSSGGGHALIARELRRIAKARTNGVVGFVAINKEPGQVSFKWNSVSVNVANFGDRPAPERFREPIRQAVADALKLEPQPDPPPDL